MGTPNDNPRQSIRLNKSGGKLASLFRNARTVVGVIEAVLNLRVIQTYGDGTSILPNSEADVKLVEGYLVITLNQTAQPGSGGSSSSVPFSGAGAPSAATLAMGNYVAGPVPSLYVDLTVPALYVCTTAGTAATSQWQKINGGGTGGNYAGTWNPLSQYTAGQIVRVQTNYTSGGGTSTMGVFGCIKDTAPNPSANQVPQFPEPAGTVYWQLIAFGAQAIQDCTNGTVNVYINASQVF